MPIKADKSLRAYYNEIDPFAAQWMRNLMAEGWITKGDVDERSIEDVKPSDLTGYDRLHFFAGVAVWDYALNQAGWGRGEIWTGSCPCQPFSAAGKGAGFADERHLWPAFHHLIRQCRPAVVLGEQVASKDGLIWFDLVQADMEGEGYACAAVDTCAAGFGAPHIRQRLYWVADSASNRWVGSGTGSEIQTRRPARPEQSGFMAGGFEGCTIPDVGETPGMATRVVGHANNEGSQGRSGVQQCADQCAFGSASVACGLGQPNGNGCEPWSATAAPMGHGDSTDTDGGAYNPGPVNGHWADADWLLCRDGKWRPVEPGTFPLVDGAPARVGRLRGYGNAINAIQAQAFIEAVMQTD